MPVVGITGGVASGKSTVFRLLADRLGADGVSTDVIARDLLDGDRGVVREIKARFGSGCLDSAGRVSRDRLRSRVFTDPAARRLLESILHPRIRRRWLELALPHRGPDSSYFLVEIPLLFETRAEDHCDRTLAVGCSEQTQLERMRTSRGLDGDAARAVIRSQLPVEEKLDRADRILWNDGEIDALNDQITALAADLAC